MMALLKFLAALIVLAVLGATLWYVREVQDRVAVPQLEASELLERMSDTDGAEINPGDLAFERAVWKRYRRALEARIRRCRAHQSDVSNLGQPDGEMVPDPIHYRASERRAAIPERGAVDAEEGTGMAQPTAAFPPLPPILTLILHECRRDSRRIPAYIRQPPR